MAFTSVTLTGSYADRANGDPARGYVSFQLSNALLNDGVIAARVKEKVHLTDGSFTINLPATNDTGTTPVGATYEVVEHIDGASENTYSIELVYTDTTQDLADIAPTDAGDATYGVSAATFQDHLTDETDAHDASAISFTPAGTIASVNTQGAIEELDTTVSALATSSNEFRGVFISTFKAQTFTEDTAVDWTMTTNGNGETYARFIDTDGFWASGSPTLLTIPAGMGGVYELHAGLTWGLVAGDGTITGYESRWAETNINGGTYRTLDTRFVPAHDAGPTTDGPTSSGQYLYLLEAGDVVRVIADGTTDADITIDSGGRALTNAWVSLVFKGAMPAGATVVLENEAI